MDQPTILPCLSRLLVFFQFFTFTFTFTYKVITPYVQLYLRLSEANVTSDDTPRRPVRLYSSLRRVPQPRAFYILGTFLERHDFNASLQRCSVVEQLPESPAFK